MKAYRFKAVYNESPLFEFQVSESSNLDFLAQNLCESMQVEYDRNNTYMFTKKKGRNWDSKSRINNNGFADKLISMQFRAGKKFFIVFDEDNAEGIEIQYLSKNNDLETEFEIVSKPKKLTVAQLTKLSLKSLGKGKKAQSKKSKKSEKQVSVLEEPEEDDFIEEEVDDEDSLHLTDADFERDYAEEDEDLDESGIFDADEIESIDEDLDDALDIDDEEDYIDEEDDYYDEDDEDYIDKYESDEDDDDDDYYSDYDDDDDDDDDYYDDDYDEDDDDDRY